MNHFTVLTAIFFCVSLFIVNSAFAESYTGVLKFDYIPSKINSGNQVTFSGQLYTTSGHVVTDATVYIKDDVRFGSDDIIKKVTTDSNGNFGTTWIATPRSSGTYDFYAVYHGSDYVSKTRSLTQSVHVSSYGNSQNSYQNSYQSSYPASPVIVFDRISSQIHAGDSITFTGKLTSNGKPLSNKLVKIMEDDPFSPDQRLGYDRTDSNGYYSITWKVSAGLVETDFDIYAVFDGDSSYDRVRSYNQVMSVLKYGGSLVMYDIPNSARIGESVTFSGRLDIDSHSSEGAIVYIKDEDPANGDDLLATGYVDEYGKFSATWIVSNVDADNVADIYAVFEGNGILHRLTTCDSGPTKLFGGSCFDTRSLRIYSAAPYTPPNPGQGEYMKLYYSMDLPRNPTVAIVPSPDSYNMVRHHIIPVMEGVMMWETYLESEYGGRWDIDFEIIDPKNDLFFDSKPDIIINLVTHDDHSECYDQYYGVAFLNDVKPIQSRVCSTSQGQPRLNADVSATAAHEFIHAMGLGHTFNKKGDMMCSVENNISTCGSFSSKSKMPSTLNLDAVVELYGSDGFTNPNRDVIYGSIFTQNGYSGNNDENNYTYTSPVTTSNKCDKIHNDYDFTIENKVLKPSWYEWWTLCSEDQINYWFGSDDKQDGFMIFLLPPETDVSDFINDDIGKYYTCEEYGKTWVSKSNSCNVKPGSSLVLYNYNESTIRLDGYIRN